MAYTPSQTFPYLTPEDRDRLRTWEDAHRDTVVFFMLTAREIASLRFYAWLRANGRLVEAIVDDPYPDDKLWSHITQHLLTTRVKGIQTRTTSPWMDKKKV